jgi:hypothetical protein
VETWLLWTESPRLMRVPEERLDAALSKARDRLA